MIPPKYECLETSKALQAVCGLRHLPVLEMSVTTSADLRRDFAPCKSRESQCMSTEYNSKYISNCKIQQQTNTTNTNYNSKYILNCSELFSV